MTLKQILSKENREALITNFEREKRRAFAYSLWKKHMPDVVDLEYENKNSYSFWEKYLPEGLELTKKLTVSEIIDTLTPSKQFEVIIDRFGYEEYFTLVDWRKNYKPHLFEKFKDIDSYSKDLKEKLISEFYSKNSSYYDLLSQIHILTEIAAIDQETFIELYYYGINCENAYYINEIGSCLFSLAPHNPDKFIQLLEEGMDSTVHPSLEITTNLEYVAKIDMEKYLELYKLGCSEKANYCSNNKFYAALSIYRLAFTNHGKYLKLFKKGMVKNDANYNIEVGTLFSLKYLYESADEANINITKDDAHDFACKFLESKYILNEKEELKSLTTINRELSSLANDTSLNFKKIMTILRSGQANNLDEIIECSKIESSAYQVIAKLGQGASGTTYLAYNEELKQQRALKLIELSKVNPKEAELLARLNGQELDNIIQIYDAGNNIAKFNGEERYAIVMEYVDGLTLEELLKDKKPNLREVAEYSAQILNGIKNLRKRGITHRDLNLRNIKIDSNGTIKILDFGIATDEENPSPKDARRYGTPNYIVADDLFSFALITYELMTGEHLVDKKLEYEGSNTFAQRIAKLKEEMYINGKLKDEYKEKLCPSMKYHPRGSGDDNETFMLNTIIFSALDGSRDLENHMSLFYRSFNCHYYFMSRQELINSHIKIEKAFNEEIHLHLKH